MASELIVLGDCNDSRALRTMLACAKDIQEGNLELGGVSINQINVLSLSCVDETVKKLIKYFSQALAQKINEIHPQGSLQTSSSNMHPTSYLDMHLKNFYDAYPYLKFAHFPANQAILEAFSNINRVHIIDFGLKQGMQWPALLQGLALRPGGPPTVRLTAFGSPQADNSDDLQEVGYKLGHLAQSIGIKLEFRGIGVNSLADINASMLYLRPTEEEAVAVNSVFELHRLLAEPGAIERVLNLIKLMNPKIVTIAEQDSDHNSPVFYDRFQKALAYYLTMFNSRECTGPAQTHNTQDLLMSDEYLGRQIFNVLSCEGPNRVERHETLTQWMARMSAAGFQLVHLGPSAYRQASLLLALFGGGNGYKIDDIDGCLTLSWDDLSLVATSAWRLAAAP